MRTATPNEVCRTAYTCKPGRLRSHKICPSCKSHDTDQVMDAAYLRPFQDFWQARKCVVMECVWCGAFWSIAEDN